MENDELRSRVFSKLISIMDPILAKTIVDDSPLATLKRIDKIICKHGVEALAIRVKKQNIGKED